MIYIHDSPQKKKEIIFEQGKFRVISCYGILLCCCFILMPNHSGYFEMK